MFFARLRAEQVSHVTHAAEIALRASRLIRVGRNRATRMSVQSISCTHDESVADLQREPRNLVKRMLDLCPKVGKGGEGEEKTRFGQKCERGGPRRGREDWRAFIDRSHPPVRSDGFLLFPRDASSAKKIAWGNECSSTIWCKRRRNGQTWMKGGACSCFGLTMQIRSTSLEMQGEGECIQGRPSGRQRPDG